MQLTAAQMASRLLRLENWFKSNNGETFHTITGINSFALNPGGGRQRFQYGMGMDGWVNIIGWISSPSSPPPSSAFVQLPAAYQPLDPVQWPVSWDAGVNGPTSLLSVPVCIVDVSANMMLRNFSAIAANTGICVAGRYPSKNALPAQVS